MKRRRGFVLPLVLIFLLIGGTLTSVTLDLATRSQNSSMNMTTTQELYNAAQSGIEWGKTALSEHREDLDWTPSKAYSPIAENISDLYATYDDDGDAGTAGPTVWSDEDSRDLNDRYEDSNIHVKVEIFNCNYKVSVPDKVTPEDNLPPVVPPVSNMTAGEDETNSYTNGTTVIMDPYRTTTGGGYTAHYFVIRATATDLTSSSRSKTLETMVVIME